MRRSALFALLLFGALGAPSEAATSDVSVANTAFTPAMVQIAPGDTVKWTFAGPDLNHSTTSDAGQAESWESDPGNPAPLHVAGDTFSHTFNTVGTYGYYCRVHTYMRGTVRVAVAGSEPPPSGGGQPEPGGQQQPPAADTAAPVVSVPRVSVRRRRVSFTLDEAASVQAKLRGRKTKRTLTLNSAKPGTNTLKLPKRLSAGRYALMLTATDPAGNASAPLKVKFTVKR